MADSLDEAVDWLRDRAADLECMVRDADPHYQTNYGDVLIAADVAQVAHYLADLMMRVGNLEAIVQSLTDKMAEGFNAVAEVLEGLK